MCTEVFRDCTDSSLILSEEPRMSISGGDHIVTWQEGKILVFDDSFEHEVSLHLFKLYKVTCNGVILKEDKKRKGKETHE